MSDLTHLDEHGAAHMVDVGEKSVTERSASAQTLVSMQPQTLARLLSGDMPKGDVIATARIAGIQAAKKTPDLIPLCHPLMLSAVSVDFEPDQARGELTITATCKLKGRTGVEMEALTAVSVAALTIYDMCKAVEKGIVIGPTRLIRKSGGKSGDFQADTEINSPDI